MSLKKDIIGAEVQIGSNEAQKSLTELAQKTATLTNENDRLRISQAKLKALGKENTDEYKKITQAIKENSSTIKTNQAQMDALRKTLGLSDLSMKQLRAQATNLRKDLSGMNQGADPVRWKKLNDELKATEKQMSKVRSEIGQTKGVMGSLGVLMPALGFAAIAATLKNLGSKIISVRSEFEKYEAILTNTLGSNKAARKELSMLSDFAAKTPFALTELTGAFVKLTNYGLKPSREEMRKYGDLASSVGKGFDQLVEAVADATTFEFERLKEFGIKAKKEGDKISFTFKEQTTVVDASTQAIKNYMLSLGDLQGVAGSMAAIAETLGGRISNIGDSWDRMLNKMGEGTNGVMVPALNGIQKDLDDWTKLFDIWASDRISKWEKFLASFSQVQMDKVWNKLETERFFENMRNVEEEESTLAGSAIEKQQKEAAKKKEEQRKKDIEIAKKTAEDKIKEAKKSAEALAKFLEKSATDQQDAINKYFHDSGEEAFDAFMKAIEAKQNENNFSLTPDLKPEEEVKDPTLDYASKKFMETQGWLEIQHKAGIIGEQEYQDKLTEINKKAEDERFKVKEQKIKQAQELTNMGANFVSALMDLELTQAGDNEEKKAQIRKKYAGIQFAVTASQIIVDTAAAVMKALAELGPIAGPIAAAIIGATGAVQLGIANAERKKMMGSKQSGGFSSTNGPDDEPDGVYHKNEFIGSAPTVRNPTIRKVYNIIDLAQKQGRAERLNLPAVMASMGMLPAGRQSGGYASASSASSQPFTIQQSPGIDIARFEKAVERFEKIKLSIDVKTFKEKFDLLEEFETGGLF